MLCYTGNPFNIVELFTKNISQTKCKIRSKIEITLIEKHLKENSFQTTYLTSYLFKFVQNNITRLTNKPIT